jgi:uncharacterized protein (DUF302 family)
MPTQTSYSYTTRVNLTFDEAVQKTTDLLKEQGFGLLTAIDVKAKMKEKIDKDMDNYVILGACNPGLAGKALDSEIEIGLLLPCNVIVYRKNDQTHVSSIMPSGMMGMIKNPAIDEVSCTAEEKLRAVIDQLNS